MPNPKAKKTLRIIRGHHRKVVKPRKKPSPTVALNLRETPPTAIDGPVAATPQSPPPIGRPIDFDTIIRRGLK